MSSTPRFLPVLLATAALALTGCAPQADEPTRSFPTGLPKPSAATSSAAPSTTATGEFPAYAVTAAVPRVSVHDAPEGKQTRALANPVESGAPLTFLLQRRQGAWLEVLLPVRPNGSTGWVRAADVTVTGVPYSIDVKQGAHVLELYERDRLVRTYPIGIGTRDTPTPGGTFYLKELLRAPDPTGAYGPFAYGLSGFSTTLKSFAGGEAVIGLHGTNDPSSIGKDVSAGCIRLRNADITALAQLLPLGTPVRILA